MYEYDDIQDVAYEEVNDNPTEFVNRSGGAPDSDTVLPTGITAQYGVIIDTNLKRNSN
jgi:hypothetical protein